MDAADQSKEELWALVPFINNWESTITTVNDLLGQERVKVRVLLLDNGSDSTTRERARTFASGLRDVLIWQPRPALPSLAASWNNALEFVWNAGGGKAWVCNNDIRLGPDTAKRLLDAFHAYPGALFISGVGVDEATWEQSGSKGPDGVLKFHLGQRGGPDFSCFIITKQCWEKYPFDELFIPAYCEDLDYHRRLMLGGDGRRIFSVNVPFLHCDRGSGTLKAMEADARRKKEEEINRGSRAYYVRKWGGPVNEEKFWTPFDVERQHQPYGPTTPELQRETWRDAEDLSKN